MTELATEVTTEEVTEDVQPGMDDILDNIADGLVDDEEPDQPDEEVEEEKEEIPDEAAEVKPEIHKVKVDGEELEIDIEEMKKGYQIARHNTQKAQALAERERQLSPVIGLAKKLQEDPEFQKHVFAYGKEEKELDPIEQIEASAVEKAEQKLKETLKKRDLEAHQQRINATMAQVQVDPDYNKIQTMLKEHVESQPPHLQQHEYMRLDADPDYYLEKFKEFKEKLKPEPEEKKKPPTLVAPGGTENVQMQSKRNKTLDKKKAKVLATGDLDALEDWLTADGGVIDSLGI